MRRCLEQEFDLVKPSENGGSGGGFFREKVGDAVRFMTFIVDRLHVTKSLACHP